MFKFESSKVRPVADLPLNLGTQPQNFSTQPHATLASAPAASGPSSGLGSKIPIGEVPNEKAYRRLVELQRHFMVCLLFHEIPCGVQWCASWFSQFIVDGWII